MALEKACLEYAEVVGRVKDFLRGRLLLRVSGVRLTEDTQLLEHGALDSTGVLELVSFLEQEFGITVADEEIVPDNLNSLRQIAGYVSRKLGESRGRGGATQLC